MSDQVQFEQMLVAITGTDNILRKQAEEAYNNAVEQSPVWVVQALTEVACRSENINASNVAFVMLRKLLVRKNNAFDQCDAATQGHVKSSLIEFFGGTQDKLLRRACASCISNLAVKLSSDGNNAWPELWDLLMGALQDTSAAPEVRAACCLIFNQTATFLAAAYLRSHLDQILSVLALNLNEGHQGLAKEATEALVELVRTADKNDVPALARSSVIPSMLQAAGNYVLKDEEVAEAIIGGIGSICESRPEVVKPHLATVLNAMMSVARNAELDKDLRHIAIDTILTYGEADPVTFRKDKQFGTDFFELMVQYTSRPQMESDWATTYETTDEADGSDFEAGASAMDRVCLILKGKQVQDLATRHIMANINSEQWEMRAAALTVLTYVAEGCQKQFLKHLDMIVDTLILPRVTDPHPMVRYCAMQSIAQMSTDFTPMFQQTYGHKILPALCGELADEVPRLQAMAAATMNQFFDELEEDDEDDYDEEEWENRFSSYKAMQQFMNPIATALIEAFQKVQYPFQRHSLLLCMATCTSVAGKLWTPFVDQLVPLYQEVLAAPDPTDSQEAFQLMRKIRCSAIECTTLLASHVGAEPFAQYSHSVCHYLISLLGEGLDNDDIRLRYILRGWTCMVECLKTEVLPYMDTVMPQLLQVANLDCDAQVTDAEVGDDEEANQKDSKVQIVRIAGKEGTKTVKLHTGLIEDKDLAITIIMCIAQELKGHLMPYLQPIMETSIKLLSFLAYPDIRDTATETLAALSVTVKEGDPANAAAFVAHVAPPLLEALRDEPELSVARQMVETVGILINNAPENSLNGAALQAAAEILTEIFDESLDRLEEFLKEHAKTAGDNGSDEDDEVEALAMAAKDEDFLLTEVAETVGKLVKTSPEFIPQFNQVFLPFVSRLLDTTKPGTYHRLGICILCDFVEHAPAAAVEHLATIAQAMVTFAQSGDSEVVQAAMFGGGITAELVARAVPQPNADSIAFARSMAQYAVQFLLTPDSRSEEGLSVSANAVSAILRIIEAFPNDIDIPTSMRAVVSHLPVQDDKTEEIRINDRLVQWAMDPANPVLSDPSLRGQVIFAVKRSKYMSDEARAALAQL